MRSHHRIQRFLRRHLALADVEDLESVFLLIGDTIARTPVPLARADLIVRMPNDHYNWYKAQPEEFRRAYADGLLTFVTSRCSDVIHQTGCSVHVEGGCRWGVSWRHHTDDPDAGPENRKSPELNYDPLGMQTEVSSTVGREHYGNPAGSELLTDLDYDAVLGNCNNREKRRPPQTWQLRPWD